VTHGGSLEAFGSVCRRSTRVLAFPVDTAEIRFLLAPGPHSAMLRTQVSETTPLFEIAPLPRTLEATLRDAESARVEVRKSVLRDLVRHSDGEAKHAVLAALCRLLRTDSNGEVRALSAIACADTAQPEVVADLLDALEDAEPKVTQFVLLALGEFRDIGPLALERIIPYRKSALPALRYQSLSTCYNLHEPGILDRLIEATSDSDVEVRWLGWHLLADCCSPSPSMRDPGRSRVKPITEDAEPFHSELLARLKDPAQVAALFHSATSDVARVKAEAAILLLEADAERAFRLVQPLLDHPKGIDPYQFERLILKFGEVGCRLSVPWMSKHARRGWFEGRIGWYCLVALAHLGERDARQEVVRELESPNARRRSRALAAVRRLRLVEATVLVERLAKHGAPGLSQADAEQVLLELSSEV